MLRIKLYFSFFVALLDAQAGNLEKYTRFHTLFPLFLLLSFQLYAIQNLFSRLPENWLDIVISELPNPFAILILLTTSLLAFIATISGLMLAKITPILLRKMPFADYKV